MQRAVNDVQQEFVRRIPTDLPGSGCRGIGTHDNFTIDKAIGLIQHKADDVGRLIVLEILAINALHGGVIDDSHRNIATFKAFAAEHGLNCGSNAIRGDWQTALLIRHSDDER